jgi:endoglucanase
MWGGEKFFNAQAVKTTVDWGASVIRAPVGVATPNANPPYQYKDGYKVFVRNAVRAAVDNGIYVIIDWHVEGDSVYEDKATAFFSEMARAYGDKPNVIFEIWNEPINAPWSAIKSYAHRVIAEIRKYSPNLVIVGSPQWSTEVDKPAADPVADANVAYTFHFYACSHPGSLRERVRAAAGTIPIFFTEWGTSESSGSGTMCADSARKWLDLADELGISWANWSLFNKNETSAALAPSAGPWGGWTDDQLSASGKWVKSKIREAATPRNKK